VGRISPSDVAAVDDASFDFFLIADSSVSRQVIVV
jgi:hypothetical protein